MKGKMKRLVVLAAIFAAVMAQPAALFAFGARVMLTVGAAEDFGAVTAAEIYAQALEKAKFRVERKYEAGEDGEHSLRQSLLAGEIDWYAAYSGETADADGRLVALEPVAANHEWGLAVLKDTAEARGLSTLSDLRAQAGELTLAATQEFLDSPSGFSLLTEKYGAFAFKKKTLAVSEDALHMPFHMKQVDTIPLRADDGHLSDPNHVRLADDLGAFPPEHLTPRARREFIAGNAKARELWRKIAASLDRNAVVELNSKVVAQGLPYPNAARAYLKAHGFFR